MKDTGFSGYIVEVCTYEYIGDFHGIGRYFEPHFDWVHVGFGTLGLARLEQTLIKWSESIGREYQYVKTLHTADGWIYGKHSEGQTIYDVEVLFSHCETTKQILVSAQFIEDIPEILKSEKIDKIIAVSESKIKYQTEFCLP